MGWGERTRGGIVLCVGRDWSTGPVVYWSDMSLMTQANSVRQKVVSLYNAEKYGAVAHRFNDIPTTPL